MRARCALGRQANTLRLCASLGWERNGTQCAFSAGLHAVPAAVFSGTTGAPRNPTSARGLTRREARHHRPLPALVLLKHDAQRALQRGHDQLAGLGQDLRGRAGQAAANPGTAELGQPRGLESMAAMRPTATWNTLNRNKQGAEVGQG